MVGHGGQTFSICGDFGLVLGVYVVPDTAFAWGKEAMAEVVERHKALSMDIPRLLYMDCAYCNGKPGFRDLHGAAGHVPLSSSNDTSVASL